MVKIGITGAGGFIGSNLCEALVAKDYQIVAVDNLGTSHKNNLSHLLKNRNIEFQQIDICNRQAIAKIFKETGIIIHLASLKIPRYGNRLATLLVNTQSTENILEIAKVTGAKVVFTSTSDVYGKNDQLPFKENSDSVLGPSEVARWAYAVSKIFDEHLCFGYWEKHGVPFVILRPFNVYGPKQARNWLGGPQSLFIDAILANSPIEIHGTGLQTRVFTYIDDIVEAIVKTLKEPKAIGQIINLGSTQEISIINFAKLIAKLAKKPLKIKKISYESFTGKPYEDVLKRRPDIKKAKSILDWEPTTSLETGLKKTIDWHRENPI